MENEPKKIESPIHVCLYDRKTHDIERSKKGVSEKGIIESPEKGVTAILVCHGMGQQVPFETVDCMAKALRDAHKEKEKGGQLMSSGARFSSMMMRGSLLALK